MSNDPNKNVSGDLGEGTGIRDGLDPELEKSDELLEESIIKKQDKPTNPLILIGERSKKSVGTEWVESTVVRCHRCGTSKNDEDKGMFIQINSFIAWFHNVECHANWIGEHGTNFKTGALINEYGKEI